jgi:hypothetical protein
MAFTKEIDKHIEVTKTAIKDYSIELNNEFMENLSYPEFVKEFMREYGSLNIKKYYAKKDIIRDVNRVVFDISQTEGINGISEGYGELLGKTLFPIGSYQPENCDIAVDEDGYVYLLGEYCFCAGKELYRGIEQIIRAKELNMLELDPSNDTEVTWLELTPSGSDVVDLETYEFNYDFLVD